METKQILKNLENYKNDFKKEKIDISLEEIETHFYLKKYFYAYEHEYIFEDIYEITFDLAINSIKNYLQELEYFINVKPQTPLSASDFEILSNNQEEIAKYYLNFHRLHKKYIINFLEKTYNTKENLDFVKETLELTKKYTKFSLNIQKQLIENLNKKLEELNKKEESQKIEGSMYI